MGYKRPQSQLFTALMLGLAGGISVTLIMGMISATLLASERIEMGSMDICAMASLLLGSAASSAIALGRVKKMRLPVSAAAGITYFAGLLSCGALMFDGVKGGVGVSLLVALAGAITVSFLWKGERKRTKIRSRKLR